MPRRRSIARKLPVVSTFTENAQVTCVVQGRGVPRPYGQRLCWSVGADDEDREQRVLDHRQITRYLLQRGFVSAQAIVEGDLSVVNVSRRNLSFKVISERGASYLVKQGVGQERESAIANEALIYQLLHSDTGWSVSHRYLPALHTYAEQDYLLVIEHLQNAMNWVQYHQRVGRFPTGIAKELGYALASLHRLDIAVWTSSVEAIPISLKTPPWVLSVHHPDLMLYQNISDANCQLIGIVQQFAIFGELLDELRGEWQNRALVHYDIKWENLMVAQRKGNTRNRLKVVDWELAGVGDPCWDVGSLFGEYLTFWLLSIPITGEESPDRFLDLARYPLTKMQPAMRAFWRSYVQQMGLDPGAADVFLLRSVRYAAVRLLQSAFEQMQTSAQVTGNVVSFLQVSLNILKQPQIAALQLLGIPSHRTRVI